MIEYEDGTVGFHDKYRDPFIGGRLVGEFGSRKYILSADTGLPISNGSFNYYLENGTLMSTDYGPVFHTRHSDYFDKKSSYDEQEAKQKEYQLNQVKE
ncbi:unnamed protein product [marine sediment metagenome]|uniref:Uncharacterized protein n=1 Tax=marine sediment metagenome TaxID=412755 RepID=X0VBT0_9ZZZZ